MYDRDLLHKEMMDAFKSIYPGFSTLKIIFSGEPGSGKSTVISSVPVPAIKHRIVLDNEDSCAFLDAGKDGGDIYEPRRQQFQMIRMRFPTLEMYAEVYRKMKTEPDKIGALAIDNLAIFQDLIVSFMQANAGDYNKIKAVFKSFDVATALPNYGIVTKVWTKNPDGSFWASAKAIPKQMMLQAARSGIHFIGTTEQANVWADYGTAEAKIVGQKAKMWDVWYRYTDCVIGLVRDPNSTQPPKGQLYPNQPKMRIQGLNPTFPMDWAGFINEIRESQKRDADIPEDKQVKVKEVYEE